MFILDRFTQACLANDNSLSETKCDTVMYIFIESLLINKVVYIVISIEYRKVKCNSISHINKNIFFKFNKGPLPTWQPTDMFVQLEHCPVMYMSNKIAIYAVSMHTNETSLFSVILFLYASWMIPYRKQANNCMVIHNKKLSFTINLMRLFYQDQ